MKYSVQINESFYVNFPESFTYWAKQLCIYENVVFSYNTHPSGLVIDYFDTFEEFAKSSYISLVSEHLTDYKRIHNINPGKTYKVVSEHGGTAYANFPTNKKHRSYLHLLLPEIKDGIFLERIPLHPIVGQLDYDDSRLQTDEIYQLLHIPKVVSEKFTRISLFDDIM